MLKWNRNLAKEGADPTRLLFLSRWAREREKADLAGSQYDRVMLIAMANAGFARYRLVDEVMSRSWRRAA